MFFSSQADDCPILRGVCVPLLLKGGDGFAGEFIDLKGADDASWVVGTDFGGGGRVDCLKLGVKLAEAFGLCLCFEFLADLLISAGAFEEAVEERFDVKGCAADGDDWFAAFFYVIDCMLCASSRNRATLNESLGSTTSMR